VKYAYLMQYRSKWPQSGCVRIKNDQGRSLKLSELIGKAFKMCGFKKGKKGHFTTRFWWVARKILLAANVKQYYEVLQTFKKKKEWFKNGKIWWQTLKTKKKGPKSFKKGHFTTCFWNGARNLSLGGNVKQKDKAL
jgi:hypothetical protein